MSFLVALFLITNSVFPSTDIGTDLATFVDLRKQGHVRWSYLTLFWMWLPFLFNSFVVLHDVFLERNCGTAVSLKKVLTKTFLHIPLVLQVKNVYQGLKLYKMGFGTTSFSTRDSRTVQKILKDTGEASMYESFLEAGP